jgi:hypothetical protein
MGQSELEAEMWRTWDQRQELRRLDARPPKVKMGPIVARCSQCGNGVDAVAKAICGSHCARRYVDGCDGFLETVEECRSCHGKGVEQLRPIATRYGRLGGDEERTCRECGGSGEGGSP